MTMFVTGDQGIGEQLKSGWRTVLLVVIGILGILVIAGFAFTLTQSNRARDRALGLQSGSYELMIRARSLSASVARAEAALGRYVISGDNTLGVIYNDAWRDASFQLDRFAREAGRNPAQRQVIRDLRSAFIARGNELSEIALHTRYKQNDQALSKYYQARDTASLAAIGRLLDRVIAIERRQLAQRTFAAEATLDRSAQVASALAGFGLLLLVGTAVLGWLVVKAVGDRATAAAEAEMARIRAIELEEAVEAATDQLRQEARERAQAEAKLRQMQKMEAVGQLTGGIAHDFNNMLAVVLGGLELAQRHIASGATDVSRHIDNAMEGANRAAALTRRLLAFARAEPLLPQAVEARDIIDNMSDLLDRTLGDQIEVTVRDMGRGWCVWVDRHQLESTILNLAVNARDAMDARGALTITTGGRTLALHEVGTLDAGDYVTIEVRDTGCGMTQDVIDRVFEPFFTTKPVGKGTGLGLSQIFGFVRQSGGDVGIDSTPGVGTAVTLYLPRHRQSGEAAGQSAPPPRPAEIAANQDSLESLDILVVEDDPRVLEATCAALVELGHRPVRCDDPLDAGRVAAGMERLDLIISDVLMPAETGPEMIQRLRPLLPGVGVVFVTGYAGDADDLVEFGDAPVLRKPFTISALSHALAKGVAASSMASAPRPVGARIRG
ncbi:response regulator [Sphingomonas sp. SFZ2018-12]|uniref:ATP-binding protein n=1 Tax=Sphingomonas sp. SFZ2018-12 TaxID=2683197 RepID=UPI001F105662|nr:ATP-binding protein [Sphingomonas sp. SFZ2018-12]MCH4892061.1 response regulator [Sphingomonas sp. SFZ2018-12]